MRDRKTNKCLDCGGPCDYRREVCFPCSMARFKKSPMSRLMGKFVVADSGCHEFTGFLLPNGYGRIGGGDGKTWLAHRMSWTCHFGPIPAGIQVLHRCDNRKCIRPEHLFLGTQADNMQDMIAKGRHRGTKANWAKEAA